MMSGAVVAAAVVVVVDAVADAVAVVVAVVVRVEDVVVVVVNGDGADEGEAGDGARKLERHYYQHQSEDVPWDVEE
jgi:hypothetical protein